jgi:hypothetical protein
MKKIIQKATYVIHEVLMAASVKTATFWDVMHCNILEECAASIFQVGGKGKDDRRQA